MGTDNPFRTSTQPGPYVLLASELTDCLAQRFLNRALCLALIVSGDRNSLPGIATDVAPRACFGSGTGSLITQDGYYAIRTGSIDRTFKYRDPLHL